MSIKSDRLLIGRLRGRVDALIAMLDDVKSQDMAQMVAARMERDQICHALGLPHRSGREAILDRIAELRRSSFKLFPPAEKEGA